MTDEIDTDWITDAAGNRASINYFGSEEDARKALDSLENCQNCSNCSDCSDCSDCSGCSDCSDCSGCSGCSGCSDCSDCSDCSRCSGCSDCSDCSRCSGCSGCSGCSDCSHIAYVSDKTGVAAEPSPDGTAPGWKMPDAAVIKDIHQSVYAAASQPKALDMSVWHAPCGTTHCRAGWVVTLAGEAGKKLESATSTLHAAMMIYRASDPDWRMSDFYASNSEALADMKRCAEAEAARNAF